MQPKKYLSAYIMLVIMLSSAMAFAQRPGLTGASFLKIGVGARHVGLGSAVTTISGDPTMMFWNPAGINSEKTNISLSHNEWLLALTHEAFAATFHLDGIGTIGAGLIYIGEGDIVANRDIAPTAGTSNLQADQATGATYSFYDLAVNISLARQFTDKLTLGASLKLIREKIDDLSANSIAGDFGVIYNTGWNNLTFGARLTNLGGDLEYFQFGAPIPLTFAIGASFAIANEQDNRLTAYLDATKPQDNRQLYFGGLEWEVLEKISVRGGYKFGLSGTEDSFNIENSDEGASFGAGLVVPWSGANMHLDYAFTDFGILNDTHRFSFTVSF
ncbi:PorV/PorQ family protein [bacterium]|nr:PorV/PorQ family protein [bacterium]